MAGTHANPPEDRGMLKLLFVCTANISRSPYAERRAGQALAGTDVTLGSAGVPGFDGRGMDPAMAELLLERGGDPAGHISRSLTPQIMAEADVVLVFEFAQHMRIFEADAEAGGRVLSVGQLSRAIRRWQAEGSVPTFGTVDELVERTNEAVGLNSTAFDVEDPYQRGHRVARACADEIDGHLDAILPLLTGADLPKLAASEPKLGRRRRWRWARSGL